MFKRVVTSVIGVILLLGIMYLGSFWISLAAGVLAGISCYEYCRILQHKNYQTPIYPLSVILGLAVFAMGFLPVDALFALYVVLVLVLVIWQMRQSFEWEVFSALFFGLIYYYIGFASFILLRVQAEDFRYLLFAFVIAWITDIGAFFVGRAMGKHKLAPTISPKKTVEGAVGGVVLALIFGGLYGAFLLPENIFLLLALILVASICSQMGDLLESALKRWAGVKDSGKILPGHGGILDRFDSMMMIAPIVYVVLILIF